MPSRDFISATVMRCRSHDQVGRQLRDRIAERQMDGHRHDGEVRRPQHHDRMWHCAVHGGGQLRKKFSVTRMRETRAIEHALGDGIGDHCAGALFDHIGDGVPDRGDCGGRTAVVRLAWPRCGGNPGFDNRESVGEGSGSIFRFDVGNCDGCVQRAGPRFDECAVADEVNAGRLSSRRLSHAAMRYQPMPAGSPSQRQSFTHERRCS